MKQILGYAVFCFLIIFIVFTSGCISQVAGVENFDECMAMGYPVMESYPRQCSTPEGRTFVESAGCRDESDGCAITSTPCCAGLVETSLGAPTESGCVMAACGNVCRPCGNGICESSENECICPEDCGIIGGQRDEHGCLGPAGYSWNETVGACIREWELLGKSQREAARIAVEYVGYEYATTIIDVVTAAMPGDVYKVKIEQGENRDAITVDISGMEATKKTVTRHTCTEEEKQAQICTMEYVPVCGYKSGTFRTYGNGCGACSDGVDYWESGECINMTLEEVMEVALASACTEKGSLTDRISHNDYTGTWWIDLEPNEEISGCDPACVVSESTRTAEINWRCTGALPP